MPVTGPTLGRVPREEGWLVPEPCAPHTLPKSTSRRPQQLLAGGHGVPPPCLHVPHDVRVRGGSRVLRHRLCPPPGGTIDVNSAFFNINVARVYTVGVGKASAYAPAKIAGGILQGVDGWSTARIERSHGLSRQQRGYLAPARRLKTTCCVRVGGSGVGGGVGVGTQT